ncbi:MAG: RNA polymerase sigma factor [Bacteroidota bacterium]
MLVDSPQHLWILLKQGNHRAFETVYRQNYPALFRYAQRLISDRNLADQGVQDLFVRIWESRERLAEVESPRAYLLTALRRELLAQKKSLSLMLPISGQQLASFTYSPQDLYIQQEDLENYQQQVASALNKLPLRQREAIYLKFYEELTYQEVANVMGVQYQSVINFVYRGLLALREDADLQNVANIYPTSVECALLFITVFTNFLP